MPHLPLAKPEEIGLDPQRLQRAYDLLQKWTAGQDAPIPGGTIAVGRRGKLVERAVFRTPGTGSRIAPPIRRDGMFLLAIITKPIVYLGAMMLVERGLLSLSRHVTDYLPEFAAHHKEATLVQQLFTHTSGLPDMLKDNEDLRRDMPRWKNSLPGRFAKRSRSFHGRRLQLPEHGDAHRRRAGAEAQRPDHPRIPPQRDI